MTDSLTIERLYHPDGKSLGSLWAGLSGSGKTTAVISTLQEAIRSPTFGEKHRFVIIDPKVQRGDYDLLAEPVLSADKAEKSIRKNRVTVIWPDLDFMESQTTQVIDYLFALSDRDPESSFTLVVDEASILITPSRIPPALKRVAVQGRAKGIKTCLISQRPIVNRWTDANLSTLCLMRTLPVDADTLTKRWGVDFKEAQSTLREEAYSFLWFDMETGSVRRMSPVPLPKPQKRRKRSIGRRLKDLF